MEITDIDVQWIERSIKYSGLAHGNTNLSYERAERLSKALGNSGHPNFLSGIIVAYCMQADASMWIQWERYHFHQIVTSESKMHCIDKMKLIFNELVDYHSYLDIIGNIECYNSMNADCKIRIQNWCNDDKILTKPEYFEYIIMNCPHGLELMADIRSNYLQLKTIYQQRKTHKMSSWREYCKWIEMLPYSYLITGEK